MTTPAFSFVTQTNDGRLHGLLWRLLSCVPQDGCKADPTDVYGTNLEYRVGTGWVGFLGVFKVVAERDAAINGQEAYLVAGVKATVGTSEYSWSGSAWVEVGGGVSPVTLGWQLNGTGPVVTGPITQTGTYTPTLSGNLIGTVTYQMNTGIGKVSIVDAVGDYIGARTLEIQTAAIKHKAVDGSSPKWMLPAGWKLVVESLYIGNLTATIDAN